MLIAWLCIYRSSTLIKNAIHIDVFQLLLFFFLLLLWLLLLIYCIIIFILIIYINSCYLHQRIVIVRATVKVIVPTCFRKCQSIAIQLKFLFVLFFIFAIFLVFYVIFIFLNFIIILFVLLFILYIISKNMNEIYRCLLIPPSKEKFYRVFSRTQKNDASNF